MERRIIIAGYGGQGVLLLGGILAHGAMCDNKHVTNISSYGAEMRGGTANAVVIISDKEIASPIIDKATDIIAMNQPSLDKFIGKLEENGRLFANSTFVKDIPEGLKAEVIKVDATGQAKELGNAMFSNLIMIGKFISHTGLVSKESVIEALKAAFEKKKPEMIDPNIAALEKGMSE